LAKLRQRVCHDTVDFIQVPGFPTAIRLAAESDKTERGCLRSERMRYLFSHSLERTGMMKHLFAIAVVLLADCGGVVGDAANDERELTQLVKDLNAAIVKADIAFLERVLDKDYVHFRPHGNVENRAQYLEDRKNGRVDFDSLVADEIKVRSYGDTAIVTYRSTAKGKDQDGAIDEQRRWTRVFVRRDGRWQLVHSQGTTIQKP
jgi:ketosteroid isomerase-like protein